MYATLDSLCTNVIKWRPCFIRTRSSSLIQFFLALLKLLLQRTHLLLHIMAPHRLQIAVAGLGRMGARHALNILNKTPRAELVAAFSPDQKELQWGKENLAPYGVTIYDDYKKMLEHQGLEAVVIGTATSVHAEETLQAMEKDLHVLCEKPLSTNVKICQDVVDAAKKKPHLKVMCGFSRRFDDSYQDVARKIDQGVIGRPTVIRSQTCDKQHPDPGRHSLTICFTV
jgi:myo-inositol 2-dehydrogenase/D-chiro-inositol 1-dehydrogenase